MKRAFDVVVGVPLAVLATPLILVLALLSTVCFRTWPFFAQRRIGRNGKPFILVKIRSLPRCAPLVCDKYDLSTVDNTRYGRFIRRTHLDELPQLWMVVTGRMSLVGPRPDMPELLARFDPTFVEVRQRVRPGCTGLWQLSKDAPKLIGESPQYDLFYVRQQTLRMDAWLLVRTVLSFLRIGKRTIALENVPRWTLREPDHVTPLPAASSVTALADADPTPG